MIMAASGEAVAAWLQNGSDNDDDHQHHHREQARGHYRETTSP
jgi:hypothetical protein